MAVNNEEYINKMYDSAQASQQAQLEQGYNENQANIQAQQEAAQKQTDANLNRTYVEAAKAAKNYNEVQNAYGLSSGAMAQARLAQDNQLQGDLTAIRTAQQTVDADIERQRTLLSQQYKSAIAQAQAENDLARAEALYKAAKEDEARLLQNQKEAGNLMASVGDYSILANLYGLTPEQLAMLQGGGGGGYYGGGGNNAAGNDFLEKLKNKDQKQPPALLPLYAPVSPNNPLALNFNNQTQPPETGGKMPPAPLPLYEPVSPNNPLALNFNKPVSTGASGLNPYHYTKR